jgi:hypothetical protein
MSCTARAHRLDTSPKFRDVRYAVGEFIHTHHRSPAIGLDAHRVPLPARCDFLASITAVDRLLLLLEQILEDELAPSAAACVHQRATLVELSQLDGCEPELFG